MRDAGYEVTLVGPHDGNTLVDDIRIRGLTVGAHNRLERMTRRPLAAFRAARATQADLYHFHDPDFLPFGPLLARGGARVVYDAHEDLPAQVAHKDWIPRVLRPMTGRAMAAVEATCIARIDAAVTVNDHISKRLGMRQPRTVVVANYPRHEEIVPSRGWSERERAVCYIGSITSSRGAQDLVRAMEHVEAELYLAGSVSHPALLSELERHPGWSRVRYLGQINRRQVTDLLGRVRAGIMPLHPTPQFMQAYPVKMFEYMIAGIPIVATDMPHWRTFMDAHGCGVCVPPGSPEHLAAAINVLLDDPDAAAMGERGRAAARRLYSWESQASILIGLYRDLLAKSAGASLTGEKPLV
ncbi:glycosyltransferase family 4 protein [Methylobacterium nigriterrae]|uniref:glycosyltransferase family 4 protein n=1 Tax=Methylobacterium nigriterrae TaxID=3127512 RepID=UPI0030138950